MTKQVYTVDGVNDDACYYTNSMCLSYTYSSGKLKEFENYDDAVKAAKKQAEKTKEDVSIRKIASVVKFPEPVFEVETLA